jgi:hypothetical protein
MQHNALYVKTVGKYGFEYAITAEQQKLLALLNAALFQYFP